MNSSRCIEYKNGSAFALEEIIDVYRDSTLSARRPIGDLKRMEEMFRHANLLVTAWDGPKIVGVARSFSDFSYITYMADLVVRESYQKKGIGKELIRRTQEAAGPNATLKLTAAPEAEDYYPRIGFVHVSQCWILPSEEKLPIYKSSGATKRTEWKL